MVESGARQQKQDWDPAEHGGFPIHDPAAVPTDGAFSQLDKAKTSKADQARRQTRVEELEEHAAEHWSDPYERNAGLRKSFRFEKKARIERALRDAALRERIGWSDDRMLLSESAAGAPPTPAVHEAWESAQQARPAEVHAAPHILPRKRRGRAPMSTAARTLAGRVQLRGKPSGSV